MQVYILYHPRERLSKCTLRPLWGRPDVHITTWPEVGIIPADVLHLAVDGTPLTPADAGRPILLVDGTWRQALRINSHLRYERRVLPDFRTAFPRVSKTFTDPSGGMASSEALYAASVVLGEPDRSWIAGYYWREEFLARNTERFAEILAAARRPATERPRTPDSIAAP